ncbi:MAG: CoA pyrophosphatase [Flammeovirgaceae bacterium]|nr:CoA pyrophosphatase [Flammeovirgaceae bacterium]
MCVCLFMDVIERLRRRLEKPLPGVLSQMKMSSPISRKMNEDPPSNAKKSAVLLLLYPHEDFLAFPLIKRVEDGRVHSGQMAFPGGRFEPQDKTLLDTALRETHEEIGVPPSMSRIVGKLTDLYVPPSNSLVSPYVAFTAEKPKFVPDQKEVAKIVETAVAHLYRPENKTMKEVVIMERYRLKVPAFDVAGEVVWGATAMIISEFLDVLNEL